MTSHSKPHFARGRRRSLLACVLVVGLTGTMCEAAGTEESRPNIVFLLADDLRFDSLGFLQTFDVQTPHLDRLARDGVRFTRSYTTTAICMASRAQIMTGRYEFSTGCNFDHGNLTWDLWQESYPVRLKQAGYITGFAGKFGFRVDNEDGSKGKADTVQAEFDWWGGWMGQGSYQISENREARAWFDTYGDRREHTTHALGLMGQDFIRSAVKSGKPFCLSISFKAPHTPYHTDPRYEDVYTDQRFPRPDNFGEENAEHVPNQAKAGRPYSKGRTWVKSYDKTMDSYHTLVHGMDQAVGRLMSELEARGVADNTVVIFTSDNGHFNGSKAMGGKIYAYEEGSLAPTIVLDPRQQAPQVFRTCDALTGNIDFAPTLLEYAEIEPVAGMQGKSMLPLMRDRSAKIHDSLMLINVWGTPAAQSLGVVTRDWKYIHWFYGAEDYQATEELYDMTADRLEMRNLAGSAEHAGPLHQMQALYDHWMDRWSTEGVDRNGYPKYTRLADRHIPFDQQQPGEVRAMSPPPKPGKIKKQKKTDKASRTPEQPAAGTAGFEP